MPTKSNEPDLTALAESAFADVRKLVAQHLDLLRADLREELTKAGTAAASLGIGAGSAALGGVLGAQMLVHLLHELTGLPLSLCYGLCAVGLGALGGGLIAAGVSKVGDLSLVPENTVQTLREDLAEVTG